MAQEQAQELHTCITRPSDHPTLIIFAPASVSVVLVPSHDRSSSVMTDRAFTKAQKDSLMLWIQGFHVIFVICWFAGIFYLPRILVYYAQSPETKAVLAVMARKLYRFVTPFMVLAIGLGLWRLAISSITTCHRAG